MQLVRASKKRKRSESKSLPHKTTEGLSGGKIAYFVKPAFPMGVKRTLRYMEGHLTLDPGLGGVLDVHAFWANGLYDPNAAVGGHQPLGFDQLMALYERYDVRKARITIYFTNNDTSNHQYVGVIATNDQAAVSGVGTTVIENGKGAWRLLSPRGVSDQYRATITMTLDLDKFLGNKSQDDTRQGSAAANPVDGVFFVIYAFNNNGTDSASVGADVLIDYYAEFTQPVPLTAS